MRGDGSCFRSFLKALEQKLSPALRTQKELEKAGGSERKYRFYRLQVGLITHAFDALGNFSCHSSCLVRFLGTTTTFIARVHRAAVVQADSPKTLMEVSEVIRRGFTDRALLPDGKLLSQRTFFRGAQSDLKVEVVIAGLSKHGLSGRPSNRAR